MSSAQLKRQKVTANKSTESSAANPDQHKETGPTTATTTTTTASSNEPESKRSHHRQKDNQQQMLNNFGVDVDDLTDDSGTDTEEDDDDDIIYGDKLSQVSQNNHIDIQEQLAAAGPAGVAAAAAIATVRKRKRPHSFETNPSVRKRQQTRLIRKLRACIDEYTMRVGQQAVVLITMPGKAVHNFKVFGAQPLESVIRACKTEIMSELEQALLEQAPQQFKEDANKHELPPLVIDGIPTPVEKMTQAQLRAFIPLMLKYSTGRGKPGWGKDTTRPPWWPETLPWANVRSDARDESEKQRISWTTTLRQIVTNCYKYHGRDDLLPIFDADDDSLKQEQETTGSRRTTSGGASGAESGQRQVQLGRSGGGTNRPLVVNKEQEQHQEQQSTTIYSASGYASNFVHTVANSDGTVSLIHVDPANAQILTLPDGTQVRAVRLQTLGTETLCGQPISELHEINTAGGLVAPGGDRQQQEQHQHHQQGQHQQHHQLTGAMQAVSVSEASLGADGQIIVTGEDGTQSCYPMSSLVSIPASVYEQFAQGGQQLSIVTADGTSIPANAVSIHTIQDPNDPHQQQQQVQQGLVEQVTIVGEQDHKHATLVDQAESSKGNDEQQQSAQVGESNGVRDSDNNNRNGT